MNVRALPKGYRQIETLDFVRNRKQLMIVNVSALVIACIMVAAGLIVRPVRVCWEAMTHDWWMFFVLAVGSFAYIVLHELTHGLLMHALSGVKPSYGFKLCYAYAGSRVYFDRRSHSIIALAPLLVWGAVLAVLERALPPQWFWLLYIIQISNVSGSAGDVYCVLHLMRLPRELLIQDTGVRMRVFAPKPAGEETK